MISIQRSMRELGEREDRLRVAIESYLSLLETAEEHCVPVAEDLTPAHRGRLRQLREELGNEPGNRELITSRVHAKTEMEEYAGNAARVIAEKEGEFKAVIRLMGEAAAAISDRSARHATQVDSLTKKIEESASLTTLQQVRQRLAQHVSELRTLSREQQKESEGAGGALRGEVEGIQQRLAVAERAAATDPLTGVGNRREAEAQLQRRIESSALFGILILDLNSFKNINDRFGHVAGDLVLSLFASRLKQAVRPGDTVCRWGGDEFLLILPECSLANLKERAAQFQASIMGCYAVDCQGKRIQVAVSASIGMAEYKPGESSQDLFARADELLYAQKGQRQTDPATAASYLQ